MRRSFACVGSIPIFVCAFAAGCAIAPERVPPGGVTPNAHGPGSDVAQREELIGLVQFGLKTVVASIRHYPDRRELELRYASDVESDDLNAPDPSEVFAAFLRNDASSGQFLPAAVREIDRSDVSEGGQSLYSCYYRWLLPEGRWEPYGGPPAHPETIVIGIQDWVGIVRLAGEPGTKASGD